MSNLSIEQRKKVMKLNDYICNYIENNRLELIDYLDNDAEIFDEWFLKLVKGYRQHEKDLNDQELMYFSHLIRKTFYETYYDGDNESLYEIDVIRDFDDLTTNVIMTILNME